MPGQPGGPAPSQRGLVGSWVLRCVIWDLGCLGVWWRCPLSPLPSPFSFLFLFLPCFGLRRTSEHGALRVPFIFICARPLLARASASRLQRGAESNNQISLFSLWSPFVLFADRYCYCLLPRDVGDAALRYCRQATAFEVERKVVLKAQLPVARAAAPEAEGFGDFPGLGDARG